jgi:hypothetical protein
MKIIDRYMKKNKDDVLEIILENVVKDWSDKWFILEYRRKDGSDFELFKQTKKTNNDSFRCRLSPKDANKLIVWLDLVYYNNPVFIKGFTWATKEVVLSYERLNWEC